MKVLVFYFVAFCSLVKGEDWKTNDGKVYKDVKVLSKDNAYVTILDSDGGGKVAMSSLSPEVQKELNYDQKAAQAQIDSDVAKEAQEKRERASAKLLYDNGLAANGHIIQVVEGGIITSLHGAGTKTHTVISSAQVSLAVSSGVMSLGQHSDVNETDNVYTNRNYQDRVYEERAFLKCDTKDLIDDGHWKGFVWKVGTYSYTNVAGAQATISEYTTDRKEAYAKFVPSTDSTVSDSNK